VNPIDHAAAAANAPGGTAAASAPVSSDAARGEVVRLAQEFEALFLSQMLRDLKRSMVDEERESSEFDAMTDTINTELGRALSASGGIGLSAVLLKALDRIGPVIPAAGAPAVSAPAGPPVSAEVTSPFGWRRDPVTGAAGFHAGIDLGLAYGQDVRAAAAGRVTFAGDRGHYGTLVTVSHPDGRETRYAHLSELHVQVGDQLSAGQVLGKAGRSGRTTGPHLHFEVLENGRPVDPAGWGPAASGRPEASAKVPGRSADWGSGDVGLRGDRA
jgi:murein DD-endopeptidase MepM/ murein hydrolase activator NlpD